MKRIYAFLIIIQVFVTVGCSGDNQPTDELITVDVTKSYPKKELTLQDFMDVEYIPLETSDGFLNQGFVQAIGKKNIIIKNLIGDGDIFVYARNGKALRKINHQGKGGEEYVSISGIVLDEEHNEMFVNDNYSKRILVYDLDGKFKRSFRHKQNASYTIYGYDREKLICHDFSSSNDGQSFAIISKRDGHITQEIQIPFKEKKNIVMSYRDEAKDVTYRSKPSSDYPIVPYGDQWALIEPSSDTIYRYFPDRPMKPFLARNPSIQSMSPEVFLFLSVITDRYFFMETIIKEVDFPSKNLVYDKQEKSIFRYVVYNEDYVNKQEVSMISKPINGEVAIYHCLHAYQLVQSYKDEKLKGKLKEIAATLEEESNPVIMLIKHKK